MRIYPRLEMVVVAIALAAAPACKKNTAGSEGAGTGSAGSAAASGSGLPEVGSGSGSAAVAPAPLTGAALGQHYLGCLESLGSGAMDKYKACLADGFAVHDAGYGDAAVMKRDDVLGMYAAMRTSFPDLKLAPQLVLVNGRNVAAIVLMTGTQSGPLDLGPGGSMPASNKKLGMMFFHRIRFDDANKQLDEWFISDSMTMMNQLGMAPKEAAGSGRPLMETGMEGAPILAVAAGDPKEQQALDAYNAGTAAFNKHDAAGFAAILADNVTESDLGEAGDSNGKETLQKNTELFLGAFSDAKLETPEVWAAGDYVVAIGTFSGTNDKVMGEMKPTNKKVTVGFAEVSRFAEGKLDRMWRFRNSMHMLQQLGLAPAMPGPDAGSGSAAGSGAGSGSATK